MKTPLPVSRIRINAPEQYRDHHSTQQYLVLFLHKEKIQHFSILSKLVFLKDIEHQRLFLNHQQKLDSMCNQDLHKHF